MSFSTYPLPLLQHARIDLPEQLQQSPCRSNHSLILTLPILDQVSQQILLHTPRLPPAYLPNSVDTSSDDFRSDSWVNELLSDLAYDGSEDVWRGEVVY